MMVKKGTEMESTVAIKIHIHDLHKAGVIHKTSKKPTRQKIKEFSPPSGWDTTPSFAVLGQGA